MGYIRYQVYKVAKIIPLIREETSFKFGQWEINTHSQRLKTYVTDGIQCQHCGIEGRFFALEGFQKGHKGLKPHLNFYGFNQYGHEIMMTSDHIVPKSRGGTNLVSNRQCLCTHCNRVKDRSIEQKEG